MKGVPTWHSSTEFRFGVDKVHYRQSRRADAYFANMVGEVKDFVENRDILGCWAKHRHVQAKRVSLGQTAGHPTTRLYLVPR